MVAELGFNTPMQMHVDGSDELNVVGFVYVVLSHVLVMGGRMMFCEVVGKIKSCWGPVDVELILFHSILDPVEAHVHGT